jgi:CBS domain-containing protein
MRCEDLMSTDVTCVGRQDTAQSAALKMRELNVGFLPVCDESSRVIGTLTDRDIAIRLVADDRASSTAVADVMTEEVVYCSPDDDLDEAERLMALNHKSRILCIDDDGHLSGVISLSDIARRESARKAAKVLSQVSMRETY